MGDEMPATPIWSVDAVTPDSGVIERAAALLRAGQLVAFPTETVYGLGANALDATAVQSIFTAKGRPATNPVIVHTHNTSAAKALAGAWPESAEKLAAAFWPGPITLVLPKTAAIPDVVTAGGPTVAIRVPSHSVALALLKAAGIPLAAPSANRSTELSPTRAEHVFKSLNGRIAAILDGGACSVGLESTVVDVTGDTVKLLRPGMITVPMLEAVVGRVMVPDVETGVARSPGQMRKHYSPRTPLVLVELDSDADSVAKELIDQNLKPIILGWDYVYPYRWIDTQQPHEYAARLYELLHEVDAGGFDRIVIEMPPDTPEWAAVRDRLQRAATR